MRPLTPDGRADLRAARQTIRNLVAGLNARNAGICTTLYTQRGVEQASGRRGPAAVAKCRRDVSRGGPKVRLNDIEGVRVVGDVAQVQFTSSVGPLAKRQTLRLRRGNGRFLIDGQATPRDFG